MVAGGFRRGRRLAFARTARRERVSRSGAWPRCALLRAAIFTLASAGRGWRTSPRRSSAAGRPRGRGRQRQAGKQGAYRAPSGSLNATPRWRGQDVRRRHVFCADWRPAFAGRDTSGGRRHPQGSDVLPPVPEHDRRNRRNVAGYRRGCRRRACRGGRRVGVRAAAGDGFRLPGGPDARDSAPRGRRFGCPPSVQSGVPQVSHGALSRGSGTPCLRFPY